MSNNNNNRKKISNLDKKHNQDIKKLNQINDIKKHELALSYELENMSSNLTRARSITVGTAFGGTTEIMMRSDGGRHIWCNMQPVEVIELIHQLAANVGCHIALKPRDDFSSWRDWRASDAEKKHLNGHAPFVNDMAMFQQLGASGFDQKKAETIMNFLALQQEYEYVNGGAVLKTKEQNNANVMATTENIKPRKSKRATTSS